ncbi:hypothetical protein A3G67_04805 [Candidatus Roizmanbacteria bacterium RIFCSPLOWO2_12_FULL_40_12]|nr:MAG: hypothetical protein A3G67_04805 [Candidatus Roizmanbacteria bacterium RIFCSPLOWO2_12_FULL_40_12]
MKFSLDFLKKQPSDESYLGLFLKEKKGEVIFLEKKGNRLDVITKEHFSYTNGWDNIVEDVDDVLYKLETHTKKSPEKAIFFIYSHLVDESSREIKGPFLHKIKDLSKKLELKPMGYIESHEGVAGILQDREGVGLTATLIELDSSFLSVFIYKSGKVIFKETVQRTHEIIDDLIPVFEKVKHIAMMPTRVILYDSHNTSMEAEKILSHRWSAELLVQLPKVEVVSEQDILEGLINLFSTQVAPSAKAETSIPEKKETLGFVIGGDVGPKKEVEKEPEQEEFANELESKPNPFQGVLASIIVFSKKIANEIKSKSGRLKTVPIPVLAIIGVCLIALAVFLMEFYFHKAELTIFFPAKKIEKSLTLTGSTSKEAQVLALNSATTATQFTDSKNATGKKEIGEKAKGTVTIYNSSLTEGKSFSKGTTLTSPNSIELVLNSDVKVASASGDAASVKPSTTKVEVTAAAIGPEGNLASDTKFSVEGESAVVIAKNDSALTGGVKRSVQTIAKQDIDDLRKRAMDKAKDFNNKEVESKLQDDVKILKDLSEIQLKNPQFSGEVGEEAGTVSLKSNITITYFSYKQNNLLDLIQEDLKKDIKAGEEIPKDSLEYSIKKITENKTDYDILVSVQAKEVRKIAKDELENIATGKKDKDIEKILKDKYGASGLELQVSDPLPLFKNRLPFFKKNINLKISYL